MSNDMNEQDKLNFIKQKETFINRNKIEEIKNKRKKKSLMERKILLVIKK